MPLLREHGVLSVIEQEIPKEPKWDVVKAENNTHAKYIIVKMNAILTEKA